MTLDRSIALLLLAAACRTDPAPAPPPSGASSPVSNPPEEAAASTGRVAPAAAASTDTEAPEATEAPAGAPPAGAPDAAPTLPDGRPILPCGDVPEDMACVPGGPFVRGSDDGPPDTRPKETVHLQTFWIDKYEVTVADYRACVAQRRCPKAGPRYIGFDEPSMPITGVSWFDARAYCRAHGKDLPTEAQWEKAARGEHGALYPWGDAPATCERAILKDHRGRGCGRKKPRTKPEKGRPWPVGSRPPGVYGLYDMVGNSWEWVLDWYTTSYADCGDACRGVDPKGPCDGAVPCKGVRRKVVRGGSWYWPADPYNTAIYRRAHVPSNEPFHHFGFRCAKTLDEPASDGAPAEPTAAPATE